MSDSEEDNIVSFPGSGIVLDPVRNDIICPAKAVFDGAIERGVTNCVVVGRLPNGKIYAAANDRQLADTLMLLKIAELRIIQSDRDF